jgi:hypothetical protein
LFHTHNDQRQPTPPAHLRNYCLVTQFFGAGLNTCTGGNVLTWSGGLFGCVADQTSTGQASAFTFCNNYGVITAATTSPLSATNGIYASSTSHFTNADFTNATTATLGVGTLNGVLYGTNGVVGTIATNTLGLLASSSISAAPTGQSSTSTANGYLSSTDFNTFNNKMSSRSRLALDHNFGKHMVFTSDILRAASLAVGSSTINGNATTTGVFFANIASSSQLFGAQLASCTGSNALTWSGGLFGCVALSTGSSFAFTPSSFGTTASNATSTLIGFTAVSTQLASSTIGGGTAISGLTILGDATTTGLLHVIAGSGTSTITSNLAITGITAVSGNIVPTAPTPTRSVSQAHV